MTKKRVKNYDIVVTFNLFLLPLHRKLSYFMFPFNYLQTFGDYLVLMWRAIAIPDRWRMFGKQYVKEMASLGVDSIGIVLLISFFIGAVICIQMKLNIQSP